MNLGKKISLFITAVFLSLGSIHAGDAWLSKDNISEYYPHRNGVFIVLSSERNSYSSCNGGKRFMLSKKHENYEVMSKALSMAFALRIPVKLVIEEKQACAPSIDRVVLSR